jgi:hypothetical protein
MNAKAILCSLASIASISAAASGAIRITEWQYNGTEFVELTNLGTTPISLNGWSFDDDSRIPGTFSLSGLGTLNPGQSGIMAELTDAAFRARFPAMSSVVPVVGGNTANLGREDEINIFDDTNTLVDRLTYGDQTRGTVRTDIHSANPTTLAEALLGGGDNVIPTTWVFSASGDAYGSFASTAGGFANPGSFSLIPEPTSVAALVSITGLMIGRRRRA